MAKFLDSWLGKAKRSAKLDRSIEAWRSQLGPEKTLSADRRARILRRARQEADSPRDLVPLFVTSRQWAVAALAPVLVLTLAVGYLTVSEIDPAPGQSTLEVSKQGGDIVFLIANGERDHRVYKSTNPDASAEWKAYTTTTGSFRDRLDSDGDLVFYRID